LNWAGYNATGGNFTSVSGSWTVPHPSSSETTSWDATWIGIGGVVSDDLIQVGTQNIVQPDGTIQTSAFYETLPEASQDVQTMTVNPGDSISASITETSADTWLVKITDDTNGESSSNEINYSSSLSSAEWIEEVPSLGNSQEIPLDNFGTVKFSAANATENGTNVDLNNSHAKTVTMINQSDESLATVSSIGNDGNSFSVTRTDAASFASVSQSSGYSGGWQSQPGIGFRHHRFSQ
jgi:hypothetical protein